MTSTQRPGVTATLDADTAVEQVDAHRHVGVVASRWGVLDDGPPNGGYVLAIALRAMRTEAGHAHVATTTAHFVRPVEVGEVTIDVERVKAGRRLTTVSARVTQDGRDRMRVITAFTDLDGRGGPTANLRPPLALPPRSDCVDVEAIRAAGFEPPEIARRLDLALHPDDTAFGVGGSSGTGLMRGWAGFDDGRAMDDLGLVVACDAFPPAAFNMGVPVAWAPTVELTVHVRDPGPTTDAVACRFQSLWATNGLIEEDGIIETADGTPLAMSRQLLVAPRG